MKFTIALLLLSINVYSQAYLKTGIGIASSTPTGLFMETDAGYIKNNNQLSLGINYNAQISRSIYLIKYGYWYNDFTFHGGIGLVNRIENREKDFYVHAYGTPIIGFDYNWKEVTKESRLYFGMDVVDKTVNLKIGIKIFYTKFSVL